VSAAQDYVPITCAFHERLEFAVLRRQRLRLRYSEGERVEEGVLLPTDVVTRDGAEWLHCRDDDGQERVLRLDRLLAASEA
jgi:transcriptional antiterminator Rof (Rho-off)